MQELYPKEIVNELDRFIIGQEKAKKAVAIALRNRWRRQNVPSPLKEEILPNNIIMIGPTGIGKTEIARRLARLANAPFLKVEASKYTEVGYVGRDVESMVRDLTELSVSMVKQEKTIEVEKKAKELAEERLLDILLPLKKHLTTESTTNPTILHGEEVFLFDEKHERSREKLKKSLKSGKLENRIVELDVKNHHFPIVEIMPGTGMEELDINFKEMMTGLFPQKTKTRKVTVTEARKILKSEEADKLIDMEAVISEALDKMQNSGIIFIDEIDKIVGHDSKSGPDVSREGVQRDILPIVEGCNVATKYGMVKTDHILFIAAGAFHISKPSDLIPELQGRFPIRVELDELTEEDFVKILTMPENSLIKQYAALLKTEKMNVKFTEDSISEIAKIAATLNKKMENIGARRLHTVMTTLLEDILFETTNSTEKNITISKKQVTKKLKAIIEDEDLSKYIL